MSRRSLRSLGVAALALALAVPAAAQSRQGPPPNRPPAQRPPLNHDRSNIPPRANPNPPGLNHDRSNGHARPGRGGPNAAVVAVEPAVVSNAVRVAVGRPSAAQSATAAAVVGLVTASDASAPALRAGEARLSGELSQQNGGARAEAAALAAALTGLAAHPERVQSAVLAFNQLVEASDAAYLADPPVAFVASYAALRALTGDPAPAQAAPLLAAE